LVRSLGEELSKSPGAREPCQLCGCRFRAIGELGGAGAPRGEFLPGRLQLMPGGFRFHACLRHLMGQPIRLHPQRGEKRTLRRQHLKLEKAGASTQADHRQDKDFSEGSHRLT
jgi:hypothetical protein